MAVKITRSQSRLYYASATESQPTTYEDGTGIVDGQWLRDVDTGIDYIYYKGVWKVQ